MDSGYLHMGHLVSTDGAACAQHTPVQVSIHVACRHARRRQQAVSRCGCMECRPHSKAANAFEGLSAGCKSSTRMQEHFSVAPGLHLKVQTVSEMLRTTLAFAAAASLLRAAVEWRQLHASGLGSGCRLASADYVASALRSCVESHRVGRAPGQLWHGACPAVAGAAGKLLHVRQL